MSTSNLERFGTAVGYPTLPATIGRAAEHLRRLALVAVAIAIFASLVGTATFGVVYLAPHATAVAGLGGMLVVWVAAIGCIAVSPTVVRRGVAALADS